MNRIVKITIKGSSGYCPIDEAYKDKLTITSSSISYEYTPEIESEINKKGNGLIGLTVPFLRRPLKRFQA